MDATSLTLLDQLRGRNRSAAWVRFVNLFTPLLRPWAERRGYPPADAADLVQSVLVKLMYEVPRYKPAPGRPFRAWLGQVLANAEQDYRKRKARTAPGPEPAGAGAGGAEPLGEEEYRQQLLRRGLEVVRADFNDQTWALFGGLLIEDRAAEDVAVQFGATEAAVYLARHVVLTRLRRELDGFLDESGAADRAPAPERERFLLGTLAPVDSARVSDWVTTAPTAAEALRALAPTDTFTEALKAVGRANRADLCPSSLCSNQTVSQLSLPSLPAVIAALAFPPTELGVFRVGRELGRGGMGAVFEATDSALGRKVALKVMLPEVAAHPHARERFLREARAAARVEHEAIVPIYQVGEAADGTPFIAMPFLQGESLDTRLRSGAPLPLGDLFLIGRQLAEGLAAAHAGGLIHRDIKPSNIWLDLNPGGSVRRARILDFGLARAPGDAVLTGTDDIVGTPAYMSVEQARGQLVDFRTDLYSLGVVLYQAATGRRPFDGGTAYAVLAMLATHNPPAPAELNPLVPPALSALIVKLMSKTPAGRPQSARAVIDELTRLVAWRHAPPPVVPAGTKAAPALPADGPDPNAPTQSWPFAPPPFAADPAPVAPRAQPTGPADPAAPIDETMSVASEPASTLPDTPDPVSEPELFPPDSSFSVEVDVTTLFQPDPVLELDPEPEPEPKPAPKPEPQSRPRPKLIPKTRPVPPPLPPRRSRRGLLVGIIAGAAVVLLIALLLLLRK